KTVTVGTNALLTLAAGDYKILNLKLSSGAEVGGAGVSSTTVTVMNPMITAIGVNIHDVKIQSPGTSPNFSVKEFISIGGSSQLTDVGLYVPSGAIHLHPGSAGITVGINVEAVANFITVEPIEIQTVIEHKCGCFADVLDGVNTVTLNNGEHLKDAQAFF